MSASGETALPVRAVAPSAAVADRRLVDGGVLTTLLLIAAQSFTIPVVAIGPSWAVWPTLPDGAVLLLLGYGLLTRGEQTPRARVVSHAAGFCVLGATLSWALWVVAGGNGLPGRESAVGVGGYQVVKLVQAFGAFWTVSRLRFDERQRQLLANVTAITLGVLCAGVFLTGLGVVRRSLFVQHLPVSRMSGPWLDYILGADSEGLGTIGYNHSYVALQLLILLALRLHLGKGHPVVDGWLALAVWGGTFLSGARNGLATTTLFLVLWLWRKPRLAAVVAVMAALAVALASALALSSDAKLQGMARRQGTLMHSTDAQNLSGRDGIWRQRLDFVDAEPIRWVTGTGFGSAYQSGNNAHMLYLQLVLETGVCGLLAFAFLFGAVLRSLQRAERQPARPVLLCTIALLLSGLTQETFYPTAAFGGFLVLYAVCVAVALQAPREPPPGPALLEPPPGPALRAVPREASLLAVPRAGSAVGSPDAAAEGP